MSTYRPDAWVVVEFVTPKETIQKVFAGWYGGFTGSDSWKLNSGITNIRRDGEFLEFDGYSGSIYRCHPNTYRMSGLMRDVLKAWQDQAFKRGDIEINILELDQITIS